MWCRCDFKSGYLFEFNLYFVKKVNEIEQGLENFRIYFARFILITSLILHECKLHYCKLYYHKRLYFCFGTVRQNRKHLPKAPQVKIPAKKHMEKGQVSAFTANGITNVK